MHLISIQKSTQIKTDWKAFLFIIALFCINIALFMQKNFVLNIANLTIIATVAIIMNLGFIRTTLGAVCDKAKNLYVANYIGLYWLASIAVMPIYHNAIARKYVRIHIRLKLILGLAIIAAGTLTSYYANVLWLNIISLAVAAALAVGVDFEFLSAMYSAVARQKFRKRTRECGKQGV